MGCIRAQACRCDSAYVGCQRCRKVCSGQTAIRRREDGFLTLVAVEQLCHQQRGTAVCGIAGRWIKLMESAQQVRACEGEPNRRRQVAHARREHGTRATRVVRPQHLMYFLPIFTPREADVHARREEASDRSRTPALTQQPTRRPGARTERRAGGPDP